MDLFVLSLSNNNMKIDKFFKLTHFHPFLSILNGTFYNNCCKFITSLVSVFILEIKIFVHYSKSSIRKFLSGFIDSN